MRTRLDVCIGILIAAALLALYAATMPRTVTLEDSGFFTLAASDAGVNHPPGYPLHALLGHLFARLPVAGVAVRVALLSAAFAAACCALLYGLARSLGLSAPAAALAAGSYGVHGVLWSQALVAEVYSLNAFLCLGLLACCHRAGARQSAGWLAAAAVCAGAGLANHWPLSLLVWPGAALLVWPARGLLLRRAPGLAALLALPPLALYGWMVWSSQREGAIAFLGPIHGAGEALDYVLRRIYAGAGAAAPGAGQSLALARFYLHDGAGELGLAGSALAFVGFIASWRRWPRGAAAAFALVFATTLAALVATQDFRDDMLGRSIVRVYPIVAWGVSALWLGMGFDACVRLAGRFVAWRGLPPLAAAVLFGWMVVWNFGDNDRRDDDWALRYAQAALDALPDGAALFTSDDVDTGPIGFAHRLLGVRPDVAIYNDMGLVFPNRILDPHAPAAERERRLESFVLTATRPVFSIADWRLPGLPSRPYGFFFEVGRVAGERARVTLRAEAALERLVLSDPGAHPWNRFHRDRLVASFSHWIGVRLAAERRPDARARLLALRERLDRHFTGRLASLASELRSVPPDEIWPALEALTARLPNEPDVTQADRAALYALRGEARRRQGRESEAGEEFLRAVEALPRPQLNRLAYLELAEHYARTGRLQQLEELRRRSGIDAERPAPSD